MTQFKRLGYKEKSSGHSDLKPASLLETRLARWHFLPTIEQFLSYEKKSINSLPLGVWGTSIAKLFFIEYCPVEINEIRTVLTLSYQQKKNGRLTKLKSKWKRINWYWKNRGIWVTATLLQQQHNIFYI